MEYYMQSVNFLAHQLKKNYGANQKHRYGMKHMYYIQLCITVVFPGNTSDWQEAISLFISNASNLMVSVKDLLKASKAAHSLPHNYTPPATMQATPLPCGYLQSPTPHHYPLSVTGSTCAPQLNNFPPGTIQAAPLNYNQPATYQPAHPHPPVIPQPFSPATPQPASSQPFLPAAPQPASPQPFPPAPPQPFPHQSASPQPFPPATHQPASPQQFPPATHQAASSQPFPIASPSPQPFPRATPQTFPSASPQQFLPPSSSPQPFLPATSQTFTPASPQLFPPATPQPFPPASVQPASPQPATPQSFPPATPQSFPPATPQPASLQPFPPASHQPASPLQATPQPAIPQPFPPQPHSLPQNYSQLAITQATQCNYFIPGTTQPHNYLQSVTPQPLPQQSLPIPQQSFPTPQQSLPTPQQSLQTSQQSFPTSQKSIPPTTTPHSPSSATPQTCFQSQKCCFASLELLKWEDEQGCRQTFRLIDKVQSSWKKFGTILCLEHDMLESWEVQYQRDAPTCLKKVLKYWLDEGGVKDYPPTWEGLYNLLVDVKYSVVAKELKNVLTKLYSTN